MNKKISLGVAIAVFVLGIALTASVTVMITLRYFNSFVYNHAAGGEAVYEKISLLGKTVDEYFYGEIDEEALAEAAAKGYVEGLGDPYAVYYTAEEYAKKLRSNAGEYTGIGVTIQLDEDGFARIIKVSAGGPAEKAGLLPDDRIVSVEGVSVQGKTVSEIAEMVSGEEDTLVTLTVRRDGIDTDYTIVRKANDLQTVEWEMYGSIGYIRITGFNGNTDTQFLEALEGVQKQNAAGIIFDLRNNGGGLVNATCECLDRLVGEGDLVKAVYANGEEKVLYTSDEEELSLPMVVLQNGNTASAAELFCATLRDYGKASIVGTQSFGKGIMQTLYELGDGSAVNFTTAKFYPHSGVSFHKTGIAPTYEVTVTQEQEEKITLGDFSDDPQLLKAVEVLKGQTGGQE